MEDEILEIQLTSPAMDLLGFEYKASTQEHLAAVASAELQLRKQEVLFLFSDGHCEHVKTSIDVSDLIENDNHAYANQKIQLSTNMRIILSTRAMLNTTATVK